MDADFFLIQRMRRGDDRAIEQFVRKYYDQILQYCRYHVHDHHYAEDVTQETFARFFRALGQYQHQGKAANYLYVVAGHACTDHLRKQAELPTDDLPDIPAGVPDDPDTRLDLERAFRRLPEDIQTVAVLFFLQERKQKEIAAILGVGLPLVKYRVRKAKELLSAYLRKEGLP